MTRNEFLDEIYKESGFMLPEDRRKAINYFREQFAGVDDEEEVCAELGEPGEALKCYLSGDTYSDGNTSDGNIRKYLKYAALLLLSPAIIYIAAAALIILLIITIAALIILSSIPLIGLGLWLGGIDSVLRLPANISFADGLCATGSGLLLSGIGIFIMLGVYKLYKKLIPWMFGEIISSYRRIRERLRR